MQFLRTTFAALCAVLFVISSVAVLLLLNIERQAFSSVTYKQAFEAQGLYQRMPEILASTVRDYVVQNGKAFPFLQVLTVQDWQNSITLLLPPDELKQMGNNALDATFDYLNGKTNSATLSLQPVKERLAGEAGMEIVLEILHRQPACTAEQLTQMALGLFGGQITLCNPPEQAIGLMKPLIQSQLQSLVTIFPNEVTFIPGTASNTANDPRLKLNDVRATIKLTPFVPVFLLYVMALFAARSLADWFTWWGWSFMFAGGISVLVGLFGSPAVGEGLRLLIQNLGVILIPAALAASIAETAQAVAHQMLIPVVLQGFILGFIGLGMVIIAIFLGKGKRDRSLRGTNISP